MVCMGNYDIHQHGGRLCPDLVASMTVASMTVALATHSFRSLNLQARQRGPRNYSPTKSLVQCLMFLRRFRYLDFGDDESHFLDLSRISIQIHIFFSRLRLDARSEEWGRSGGENNGIVMRQDTKGGH